MTRALTLAKAADRMIARATDARLLGQDDRALMRVRAAHRMHDAARAAALLAMARALVAAAKGAA